MSQRLIQTTEQQQVQRQQLSAQQLLQVRLLEMPLAQLEQAVRAEMDDNPALESEEIIGKSEEGIELSDTDHGFDDGDYDEGKMTDGDQGFEERVEREERQDALDAALQGIGADDVMESPPSMYTKADTREDSYFFEARNDVSFYDVLREQMGELTLTDTEHDVMEYLIGSLDDDGLLHKSLEMISDEMAIYLNLDVDVKFIARVLGLLQGFDPAGIGGRSLQECLLLQVARRSNDELKQEMLQVLTRYFSAFTRNQWSKIARGMRLSDEDVERLRGALRRLNPKPGASLGESVNVSAQHVTPDFMVDDDGSGKLTVRLCRGHVPDLHISPSFSEMIETYRNNRQGMNRAAKEALLYSKQKVARAKGFINAILQRQHTLLMTMEAIVSWQHTFFVEGDSSLLRPMILKDVAQVTHLNISTVSRVCAGKYVQTRWGIFPLRHFFSDGYTTDNGEALSKHEIKDALRSLIEGEDKASPLSDESLESLMAEKGYPIARRTIAKYRMQMGIPVARMIRR